MTLDKQNEFKKDLKDQLKNSVAQSKGRDGEKRTYALLLNGRFKLCGEVVRIELRENRNDISNKAFDLSTNTIENLISQGEKDTRDILDRLKEECVNKGTLQITRSFYSGPKNNLCGPRIHTIRSRINMKKFYNSYF